MQINGNNKQICQLLKQKSTYFSVLIYLSTILYNISLVHIDIKFIKRGMDCSSLSDTNRIAFETKEL